MDAHINVWWQAEEFQRAQSNSEREGRLRKRILKERAKRAVENEEQIEARLLRKRDVRSDRFATESSDQRGSSYATKSKCQSKPEIEC